MSQVLAPLGVVSLILYFLNSFTSLSITVFQHRFSTHKSCELSFLPKFIFRIWLWFTTGIKTREWVATHTKHHQFSDKEGDPHSAVYPVKRKFWGILKFVIWDGVWMYVNFNKNEEEVAFYSKKFDSDKVEEFFSKNSVLGLTLWFVLLLSLSLLIGSYFFEIAIWVSILCSIVLWVGTVTWSPLAAAGYVNGVCHKYGYRLFKTPEFSTNTGLTYYCTKKIYLFPLVPFTLLVDVLIMGIALAGEPWHNNHHSNPRSAKLGFAKWWEFDLGWITLRILEKLKLAEINWKYVRK